MPENLNNYFVTQIHKGTDEDSSTHTDKPKHPKGCRAKDSNLAPDDGKLYCAGNESGI